MNLVPMLYGARPFVQFKKFQRRPVDFRGQGQHLNSLLRNASTLQGPHSNSFFKFPLFPCFLPLPTTSFPCTKVSDLKMFSYAKLTWPTHSNKWGNFLVNTAISLIFRINGFRT